MKILNTVIPYIYLLKIRKFLETKSLLNLFEGNEVLKASVQFQIVLCIALGRGHIVFGADPFGVDVSVTVSCVRDIT